MAEETKSTIDEEKEKMPSSNPTVNEVTDKLEDATNAIIEKAKDKKHTWYTKVGILLDFFKRLCSSLMK